MHRTTHTINFLLKMTISSIFFYLLITLPHTPSSRAADTAKLIYKGCANQTFSDPKGSYSQAVSALFGSLVSASTKSNFFKTTSGSITGLFQCRGDLSSDQCYNCVSKLPVLADKICGSAIAARIQLDGCYLLYEVAGYADVTGMDVLYKACGAGTASGSGFEEKRDTAFYAVSSGVVGGHGFYTTNYQSVHALAQCEGDVGDSDCGACVTSAAQHAQVECGNAVSGEIYLNKCYLVYSYSNKKSSNPSLVTAVSNPSGKNTGRTVAIIVGAVAGVGFLAICFMFARGLIKEQDD